MHSDLMYNRLITESNRLVVTALQWWFFTISTAFGQKSSKQIVWHEVFITTSLSQSSISPYSLSPLSKFNLITSKIKTTVQLAEYQKAAQLFSGALYLSLLCSALCSARWGQGGTISLRDLVVIQAQTEGGRTCFHTWDEDSRWHVATHRPEGTLSAKVCLHVSVSVLASSNY